MTVQTILKSYEAWCYHTPLLSVLRDTKLGIPSVQTAHLIGITITLGSTFVMCLRMLRLGYNDLPYEDFVPQLWTWFRRGLYLTLVAGFIVYLPDPTRYQGNVSFRIKIATLAVAIIYQFTVFRKAVHAAEPEPRAGKTIAICATALILWFGIGWAGRAIAFVG
jgi:hypothetical protein